MSVLITGIGPVGANTARKFADEGYNVILYDVDPRKVDFLERVSDRIKFVRGDITDFPFFLETVEKNGVEGIIATALGPSTVGNPNLGFEVNVKGAEVNLEVARIRDLKLIFMSSASVYGLRPDLKPLKEDDPTPSAWLEEPKGIVWSRNLYNAQKICGEILVRAYNLVYGIDTVTIRTSFAFGPGDRSGRDIHAMLMKASAGEVIEVYSDEKKDLTYVEDLASGIFRAYTVRPLKHRIFNMSGGKLYRLVEVAEMIKRLFPKVQIKQIQGAGPFDSPRGPCDITRACQELGYENIPLPEGIKLHLKWVRQNFPITQSTCQR